MVFAARVSAVRGLLSRADRDRIEALILDIGLPAKIALAAGPLIEAVRRDKKRESGAVHFVMLEGIGNAVVETLSLDELEGYIHDLC